MLYHCSVQQKRKSTRKLQKMCLKRKLNCFRDHLFLLFYATLQTFISSVFLFLFVWLLLLLLLLHVVWWYFAKKSLSRKIKQRGFFTGLLSLFCYLFFFSFSPFCRVHVCYSLASVIYNFLKNINFEVFTLLYNKHFVYETVSKRKQNNNKKRSTLLQRFFETISRL